MPRSPSTTIGTSARHFLAELGDPDDRRKSERAGDDRGMRRGAAPLEREAADAARIQAGRVDRRKLVGHEDRAARDLRGQGTVAAREVRRRSPARRRCRSASRSRMAAESAAASFDAQLSRDLGQRPLGVHPLLADPVDDGPEERLVFGDQAMGLEDRRRAPRPCRPWPRASAGRSPRRPSTPPCAAGVPPSRTPPGRRRAGTPAGRRSG